MSETAAALHHGRPAARKRRSADIRVFDHERFQIVTGMDEISGFVAIPATIRHIPLLNNPQTDDADEDQIDRHDEVQQPRHDENEHAGNERNDRLDVGDADGHGASPALNET
jgi:hypothetical protein